MTVRTKTGASTLRGVIAPVVTPFNGDLAPDTARFVAFCRALIGLDMGLAPFGTTGEGCSLAVDEKIALIDALVAAKLPMERVMPGTGSPALSDAVRLTSHVARQGCGGALVLPPYYFKSVSDDGLFRFYAELIERVGDERLRLYLYHFPRHCQVPLSTALISRLLKAYPATIAGIKDSSGDWPHTERLCREFPKLAVFTGSDALLLKTLRAGGAGVIATNANLNGAAMVELCRRWRDEDADLLQDAIAAFRQALDGVPLIPATKALIALASGDPTWRITRPPLMDFDPAEDARLVERLKAAGFPLG